MATLSCSLLKSVDGYTEANTGRFGWGAPDNEEVHHA